MSKMRASKKALLISLVTGTALALSTLTASAALNLNPSSITISSGQNQTVSVSGGGDSYFASASTNPGAVQLQITGNSAVFSTNSDTATTASVTICSAIDASNCGTVNVTINASGSSNNNSNNNNNNSNNNTNTNPNGPTFSSNNVTINAGGSQTVTVSGSGTFFISNTSNYAVASGVMSGNSLIISGTAPGNSSITVCQSGGCNNVDITVTGTSTNTSNNSGGISFSQSNPSVAPGSTQTVTVSGGTNLYSLSNNSNPSALVATLSNNTISMTGTAPGTSILTICDSGNSCANLTVAITSATTNTTTNTNTNTTTNTSSNSNIPQGFAQALLTQIASMEAQLSQFQSQLARLKSSLQDLVNSNYASYSSTNNATFSNLGHIFTLPLDIGDSGDEVTALQNRLTADGYYSGPVTGYFGPLTQAAVKKFQSANGVTPQGNVGPGTRAALNATR